MSRPAIRFMDCTWELCSHPENYGSTCYSKRFYPKCPQSGAREAGQLRFQREIGRRSIDTTRTNREHAFHAAHPPENSRMSADRQPDPADDGGLEAAVDQAV